MKKSTSINQAALKRYQEHLISYGSKSTEDKITFYYEWLCRAQYLYSNLAYYALRNRTEEDKIINYYLSYLFKNSGIVLDDELKTRLMFEIAQADIHQRLHQNNINLDLNTIKRLHFKVFEPYLHIDEKAWNDSISMLSFDDTMLWIDSDSWLHHTNLLMSQYFHKHESPFNFISRYKFEQYMHFIKGVFYKDIFLQHYIQNLSDNKKTKVFTYIRWNIYNNPWLKDKWRLLVNQYGNSPMLSTVWSDCISVEVEGKVIFKPCNITHPLLHTEKNTWLYDILPPEQDNQALPLSAQTNPHFFHLRKNHATSSEESLGITSSVDVPSSLDSVFTHLPTMTPS